MFMYKKPGRTSRFAKRWVLVFSAIIVAGSGAAQNPNLGVPLTDEDVVAIDFTVMPDGRGLPDGAGNVGEGEMLYRRFCMNCHGKSGVGGINDQLAGGHATLPGSAPVRTIGSYWPYATTIFDFIRRAMPYTAPGSLSDDEVYALTAYLLFINNVVTRDAVMDAETLPLVEMPNAEGFVWSVQ
jgi:S-disulfanyl-L-cysteine oxidoreductase SoxD